ncbi:MAG: rod shape-determining protein MreC [Microthrixaceae bacterium]
MISLLAITLVSVDALGGGTFDPVRNVASDVLSPVAGAVRWVATPFRNAWKGVSGYDELEEENEALRQQLDELEGQAIEQANAIEQRDRLRAQLDIGFVGEIPTEVARLTGGPRNNFTDHRVEINKGADSGLEVGMPVVTKAGLIGRLDRVARTTSVVQLMTDPAFAIGVRVAETQDLGIGHGSGVDNPFVIDRGIEITDQVSTGDAVVTSGLQRAVMPPDLPVGVVSEIQPDEAAGSLILRVDLGDKIDQLDVVQVLKWVPPS